MDVIDNNYQKKQSQIWLSESLETNEANVVEMDVAYEENSQQRSQAPKPKMKVSDMEYVKGLVSDFLCLSFCFSNRFMYLVIILNVYCKPSIVKLEVLTRCMCFYVVF